MLHFMTFLVTPPTEQNESQHFTTAMYECTKHEHWLRSHGASLQNHLFRVPKYNEPFRKTKTQIQDNGSS